MIVSSLSRIATVNRSLNGGKLFTRLLTRNSNSFFSHKPSVVTFQPQRSLSILDQNNSSGSLSSVNLSEQKSRLRRVILYVPGSDQRKIDKVTKSEQDIDSIVLDCEDGVAINKKAEARENIVKTLDQLAGNEAQLERLSVRINSMTSGLAEEDLKVVMSGKTIPRTILLPKVDTITDIDKFSECFQKTYQARSDPIDYNGEIDLVIFVESSQGLLDLREICRHTIEIADYLKFRLVGVVFGSDDFCANIGATRSDNCREVLLARQQVVIVAKSFNLQAIDAVYINYKDLDGLREQSVEGASMGFTGKQSIHPAQVPVIQDAFRPSDQKIEWAKGLVAGFEQAQRDGKGAFVYEGQMIDMPLLLQAYNVLKIAKQIGKA